MRVLKIQGVDEAQKITPSTRLSMHVGVQKNIPICTLLYSFPASKSKEKCSNFRGDTISSSVVSPPQGKNACPLLQVCVLSDDFEESPNYLLQIWIPSQRQTKDISQLALLTTNPQPVLCTCEELKVKY
jgi:hypothetical protein